MRKEVLWALLLAIALVAVLFAQRQLRQELNKPEGPDFNLPFGEDGAPEGAGEGGGEGQGQGPGEGESSELLPETVNDDEATMADTPVQVPAEVQRQLDAALTSFQQKEAIAKASSAELHDTPKVIRDAAEQLANITAMEAHKPELAPAFREFYLQCARDDQTLTVIRAQCLEKYTQRAGLSEESKAQLLSELPESVVRLYRAL